jgi:hypothetical protein
MAIPGLRFLAFAARWFDAATVSRVFEPLIADWQREWTEAAPSQRTWIRVRGTFAFATAVLLTAPRAVAMAPMPASTTRRALARMIIFTSAASLVMTIIPVTQLQEMPFGQLARVILFLLPSIAVTMFPFAMPWVADALRRRHVPTSAERLATLRTAIACVAFVFLLIGWGMPIANQAYRETVAPEWARPPARGTRELSIWELIFNPPLRMQDGRNPNEIRREINSRLVITLLPAVLLWVRWGAHGAPHKRWLSPLPVVAETGLAFALFFYLYLGSVWIEPTLGLRPGTGMWLALAALVVAGVARNSVARWSRRAHA